MLNKFWLVSAIALTAGSAAAVAIDTLHDVGSADTPAAVGKRDDPRPVRVGARRATKREDERIQAHGASQTRIAFPSASDWFTVDALNVVLWNWDEPVDPLLRVLLSNPDASLLKEPIALADKVQASMFGMTHNTTLPGASPGKGYIVSLVDTDHPSRIYAISPSFELKPAGSKPNIPPPYGSHPSRSARRAAPAGVAVAAIAMLVILC